MSPGKKVLRSSENVAKARGSHKNGGQKVKRYGSSAPPYYHQPQPTAGASQYRRHHLQQQQQQQQYYHPQYHHVHPAPPPSRQQQHQQNTKTFASLSLSPTSSPTLEHVPTQGSPQKQPDPPRSAFICFKDSKKQEFMKKYKIPEKHKKILELVAKEWKLLSDSERAFWDEEARNDKVRFVTEKAAYKGPWVLPKKRAKKHPDAPKRAMSAFLAFSKICRPKVKVDYPTMTNTDVSRLLGEMWRNASEAEKAPYRERELKERASYKEKKEKFTEEQATLDATARTSHQSALHGHHANSQQPQKPQTQKFYPAFEHPTNNFSPKTKFDQFVQDPWTEDLSPRPSVFHQHSSQQYHRPVYHHSELYPPENYPQATWSALSMDESDPLPAVPLHISTHYSATTPSNGDDCNFNGAFYSGRGSSYFQDPFDVSRYPRYP